MTHAIDEHHLKVLRLLQGNPDMSQRELTEALGMSVGKANYCIRALVDKGLLKIKNFRNSQNKLAYIYLLTRCPGAVKRQGGSEGAGRSILLMAA